jgi:hypothetical protein
MKLKAKDTMHISSVKAGNILPGETFEVPDPEGKQLVDRGLATRVSAPKPPAKRAAAPRNKMAAASKNKAG